MAEALALFLKVHLYLQGVPVVPLVLDLESCFGVLLPEHFEHAVLCLFIAFFVGVQR